MLIIKIETDNAAFSDGNAGPEIARLLRGAAHSLKEQDDFSTTGLIFSMFDINGNKCGSVSVQ